MDLLDQEKQAALYGYYDRYGSTTIFSAVYVSF
jgi:hypothetical protein